MKTFENEFFYDIFLKEKYTNFLKTRSEDLWKGTPFEDYILISQSAKGSYGENIIKDICREKYFLTVERRINEEHDCIINGKKTELKFCLTETKRCDIKGNHIQNDYFHISHLSVDYDWERCIILAINTDNIYLFWFDKDTFIKITNEKKYFTLRKSNRYYLHGKHFLQFMNSEYTKTLIEW